MAEARQSAFNVTATAAGVVAAPREDSEAENPKSSWVSRWLPALALAASAAGVLFWMRPDPVASAELRSRQLRVTRPAFRIPVPQLTRTVLVVHLRPANTMEFKPLNQYGRFLLCR